MNSRADLMRTAHFGATIAPHPQMVIPVQNSLPKMTTLQASLPINQRLIQAPQVPTMQKVFTAQTNFVT